MKRLITTTIILLSISLLTACKEEKDEPDPQPKISLNGLMAYYKLDENSGTIAQDETGNWNLSFVSSPSWSAPGKINRSIEFGTTSA